MPPHPVDSPEPGTLTPIARACRRELRGVLLGLLLLCPPAQGWAQTDTPAAVRIDGGDLADVLNRYAREAGVSLSYDASLLRGLSSPGLHESVPVETGFERLLAGSDYRAVAVGPGRYVLQALPTSPVSAAPEDGVTQLQRVVVQGAGIEDGSAPNTGYTVRTTSSATKLDLAPKETPQSITTFTAQQIQDQGLLSVSEVLDQTPGITLVSAGVSGAGSQPIYSRTLPVTSIQMDGVMASTYILSGSAEGDIGMQDSFLYERIDVMRGSNSLTGGAGDASASLNFVRKHPYRDRHVSASLKYGSWNTRRAEVDYSTPLGERLRVRLAVAAQKGDHWVDRVSSDRKALSLIGALDVTDNDRLSLGVTRFDFRLDGASPHGITRFSQVTDYTSGGGPHKEATETAGRNFNNATPWSYTDREYTNLFATWEHTFDNDWSLKASYNYADNKDDKLYGEMGTTFYVPWADRASYAARRDNRRNKVQAFDLHLKGSVELAGRPQDFVIGANYYDVHRIWQVGYASTLAGGSLAIGIPNYETECSADKFAWYDQQIADGQAQWDAFLANFGGDPSNIPAGFPHSLEEFIAIPVSGKALLTQRCEHRDGISIDEWNASGGDRAPTAFNGLDMYTSQYTVHTKSRQMGVYFATHLRPFARTHLILGGRWARDENDDPYITCRDPGGLYCYDTTGDRAATQPRLAPKFLPYAGLIYELTPQINAYASYTSAYVRDVNSSTTKSLATGDWLPPVRSITYEGGLKGAFFNDRLNVAASYFEMTQKDFPYQTYDPKKPQTTDEGWRVYGWELSVAGAITPNWHVAAGYVQQKQVVPSNDGEVLLQARDDFTGSYRAPEQSFKLFSTYRFNRLTLGAGLRWQGPTKSAWIPVETKKVEEGLMKQDAFYIVDLMARYRVDKHFNLQLNVNNVLDKEYYQHERSYISGAPRNWMLTLSYQL